MSWGGRRAEQAVDRVDLAELIEEWVVYRRILLGQVLDSFLDGVAVPKVAPQVRHQIM
jgi:hypothetical protein